MREYWELPEERALGHSDFEWFLLLVDNNEPEIMGKLLLILWRCWFIRNELTHSDRKLFVETSVGFLLHYWDTLFTIRQELPADKKGKRLIGGVAARKNAETCMAPRWQAPGPGSIKINVDGAFKGNGEASIGVIIRDSTGSVLLSAWRVVSNAANAEEVELMACWEGISLAVEWTPMPTILETDCTAAVKFLHGLLNNDPRRPSSCKKH